MVGYNRIPTQRLRADARFPRGAGQAKRRQLAASGDLTPSASHRSLHPPPLLASPPHSPVPPSRSPSPTARAIKLPLSFVLPLLSLLARFPLTPRPTHTVRKPPRRSPSASFASSSSLPSRPPRAPSLPPLAGPRKRGIASNSNYRTRGYHASNLTLGRPTRTRASRAAPRTFSRGRFFARHEPESERASCGNVH